MRGMGEGHYPWDLTPNSTMTNGAVTQQVQKVEGNTLQVKYKEGEKTNSCSDQRRNCQLCASVAQSGAEAF